MRILMSSCTRYLSQFGLDGGRVESIMVSAPPLIAWRYRAEPEPGTPEHDCLEVLRKPRQWV